jgi:hypothetical protein
MTRLIQGVGLFSFIFPISVDQLEDRLFEVRQRQASPFQHGEAYYQSFLLHSDPPTRLVELSEAEQPFREQLIAGCSRESRLTATQSIDRIPEAAY